QGPGAGQVLGTLGARVPGGVAGAVGPLRDRPSAACGRADRGGPGTSSLPATLAFGPAGAPAGTADLPAAEQRARGGAVVGPDVRRGPLVAASSGPSRGGPPGAARPLLHPAPAGTGPATLGQRDHLCAATAAAH